MSPDEYERFDLFVGSQVRMGVDDGEPVGALVVGVTASLRSCGWRWSSRQQRLGGEGGGGRTAVDESGQNGCHESVGGSTVESWVFPSCSDRGLA